jgi:hypothetical protein
MRRERLVSVSASASVTASGGLAAAAIALALVALWARAGWADRADGAAAQRALDDLRRDAKHQTVTADAVGRIQSALERAARLRSAGDEAHAQLADAVARQWADTAEQLVRAADAEAADDDVRKKAFDCETQIGKTQALVEEVLARTGRLRARIDSAERGGASEAALEHHDAPRRRSDSKAAADGGAP